MRFDTTIALGIVLHLVVLVGALAVVSRAFLRRLRSIEGKQDLLLKNLGGETAGHGTQ